MIVIAFIAWFVFGFFMSFYLIADEYVIDGQVIFGIANHDWILAGIIHAVVSIFWPVMCIVLFIVLIIDRKLFSEMKENHRCFKLLVKYWFGEFVWFT